MVGCHPQAREGSIRILCGNSAFFHPKIALGACVEHPSDNVFLDCAYEANATVVSKNTHLLELDSEVSSRTGALIRVLAPEHYMREAMSLGGTLKRHLVARTRLAHLSFRRTLAEFDFSFQPSIDDRQLKELAPRRWSTSSPTTTSTASFATR